MAAAVRLGTFSPSVVLRVARATGLLDRLGVAVDEQPVPSSPAQFRALLAGDLDAVLTSPDNVLAYRLLPANPLGRTADVRILLGVDRGLGLALYARPGLGRAAGPAPAAGPARPGGARPVPPAGPGGGIHAVRGGTVGVDVAESGFAFALYEVLAVAGLRRDADYRVVELGSTPRRLDALLAGDCDATMLNAGSDLRAAAAGCRRLARAVDACRPYLGTVLAATGPACEQPDNRLTALVTALRTVLRGLGPGSGPQLREVAERAAVGLGFGPADARAYVARLADPAEGLVVDGEPDAAALVGVQRLRLRHTRLAGLDPAGLSAVPAGLVDRRFLAGR
jgi:ABC-type nitrate/sulfonate/bicarbonate transport system substrate-binding protein